MCHIVGIMSHPYSFELEDTSSADHSESSSKKNELQEHRLLIPLLVIVLSSNQIFPLYFLGDSVDTVGNVS